MAGLGSAYPFSDPDRIESSDEVRPMQSYFGAASPLCNTHGQNLPRKLSTPMCSDCMFRCYEGHQLCKPQGTYKNLNQIHYSRIYYCHDFHVKPTYIHKNGDVDKFLCTITERCGRRS